MSPQEAFEHVQIAWIEGRLENVLEREKQLVALHKLVQKQSSSLVRALQKDNDTPVELANAEVVATLNAINALYEQLDFQKALAAERELKNGGTLANFLVPLGITLVAQLSTSPVISSLAPLAAALAAGNPAIVLGSRDVSTTNALLQQIVLDALDREAFHFEVSTNDSITRAFTKEPFVTAVFHDFQTSQTLGPVLRATNPSIRVIEPFYGIPAGFIDRSAGRSIEAVVKKIQNTMQVAPYGNSLRVPRLYFVDESLLESVKERLHVQQKSSSDSLESWLQERYSGQVLRFSPKKSDSTRLSSMPTVENIVTVSSKNGSDIVLVPTRSLDHGIDLLNKINSGTGSQAIYIFAGGKEAFYLGNFITTSQVFINEISAHSIVTASCRSAGDTSLHTYRLEDFSESKTMQQFPKATPHSSVIKVAKINQKRVKQPIGGRMSFFEQGLILGVAMGLVALGGMSFWSYRGLRTYLSR
ncbi:hypothetical protein ACN47E_008727 [Coniothyrium glycines]